LAQGNTPIVSIRLRDATRRGQNQGDDIKDKKAPPPHSVFRPCFHTNSKVCGQTNILQFFTFSTRWCVRQSHRSDLTAPSSHNSDKRSIGNRILFVSGCARHQIYCRHPSLSV